MVAQPLQIAMSLLHAIRAADPSSRAYHPAGFGADHDFDLLTTVSPWEHGRPEVQQIFRDAEAAGFAMFYEHGDIDIVRRSLLPA